MKRILTIFSCAVLFVLSSCTKQYITPGTTNQTFYANVATTDWTLYTDSSCNKSYTAPINISALDPNFAQIGGVIVAISYDGGNTYEQLPEVYDNLSYSYTYNAGNVSLYAQSADGTTAILPSAAIKVKIILVDSN